MIYIHLYACYVRQRVEHAHFFLFFRKKKKNRKNDDTRKNTRRHVSRLEPFIVIRCAELLISRNLITSYRRVCRIGKEGRERTNYLLSNYLDRSLSNSSNNRRTLLTLMITKFWRMNFKNPSISFKKRRFTSKDRVRWYQVIVPNVDHEFTTMNYPRFIRMNFQFWLIFFIDSLFYR